MEQTNKFVFNCFNAPKGKPVPAGEDIYEWEYMDEKTGEIKKDKRNIKEMINSYLPTVDYKKQIERGELELNGNVEDVTRDFREIPDNTVDIIKYFTYLSSLSKEQVAHLVEQANQASKTDVQRAQDGNQAKPAAGQTDDKSSQNQSKTGGSSENTDDGGTK